MKPFKYAALALLWTLFATNCYRAATQSLTHDEALTWGLYLEGPASRIFEVFDASHHFLGTLLEKLTTRVFGFSELSLRLPSVLAGGWYFATAYRLSLFLFGEGLLFLLSVALLSVHPLVLDFLVAARGYGLALAFFLWGLFNLVRHLTEDRLKGFPRQRLLPGACGLSLAVASNLTLAFPVLALALLFLATARWLDRRPHPGPTVPPKPHKSRQKAPRKLRPAGAAAPSLFVWFVLPTAGLLLLLFLTMPLGSAQHFYYGVGSPRASLENLVGLSLAHNPGPANIDWKAGWLALWRGVVTLSGPVVVAAALGWGLLAMSRLRQGGAAPDKTELTLLLAAGTQAGSVLLLTGSHFLLGFPYPSDRTGLYFLPLAALSLAGLGRVPAGWARLRIVRLAHLAVLISFAATFWLQWNTTHFQVWRYDADTKAIFRRIEGDSRGRRPPVRVGASWVYVPALNFYRAQNGEKRFEPILGNGPDGDYDYYVLGQADRPLIVRRSLRVLWEGPVSGTILAVPTGH